MLKKRSFNADSVEKLSDADDHWVLKEEECGNELGIKLEGERDNFEGLVRHVLWIGVRAGRFRILVGGDNCGSLKAPQWQCDWM